LRAQKVIEGEKLQARKIKQRQQTAKQQPIGKQSGTNWQAKKSTLGKRGMLSADG
jgi:hypothetical protein